MSDIDLFDTDHESESDDGSDCGSFIASSCPDAEGPAFYAVIDHADTDLELLPSFGSPAVVQRPPRPGRITGCTPSQDAVLDSADPDRELTPDQQRLVLFVTAHRRVIVIGAGGTGKTRAMAAVCKHLAKGRSPSDSWRGVTVVTPTNSQMRPYTEHAKVFTTHGFTGSGGRGIADKTYMLACLRKRWSEPGQWEGIYTFVLDEVFFMESWLLEAILRLVPPHVRLVLTGDPLQLTSADFPAWRSARYAVMLRGGGCGVAVLTQNLRAADDRIEALISACGARNIHQTPEHHLLIGTKRAADAAVITANKKRAAEISAAALEGLDPISIEAVGTLRVMPKPFVACVGARVALTRAAEDSDHRKVYTGTIGTICSISDSERPTAKNTKIGIRLWNGARVEVGGISDTVYNDNGERLGTLTQIPIRHAAAQTVQGATLHGPVHFDGTGAVAPSSLPVAIGRVTSFDNFSAGGFTVANINRLCPSETAVVHHTELLEAAAAQGARFAGADPSVGPVEVKAQCAPPKPSQRKRPRLVAGRRNARFDPTAAR